MDLENNQDSDGPSIPQHQPAAQQNASSTAIQLNQPGKKNRKKLIILGLVFIILLLGGILFYFYIGRNDADVNQSLSGVNQQTPQENYSFYIYDNSGTLNVYDPKTQTKSIVEDKSFGITVEPPQELGAFRFSKDGSALIYETFIEDKARSHSGESGDFVATKESYLYLKVGSQIQQVAHVSLPDAEFSSVITPDKLTIFYILNRSDLHKYDLVNKKDTLVKENVFNGKETGEPPTLYADNKALVFYLEKPGITEYRYENNTLNSRAMDTGSFCSSCNLTLDGSVSPDGKSLVLISPPVDGKFRFYLLNLTNGEHKEIVATSKSTEGLDSIAVWSPDSKSIAYQFSPYGNEGHDEVGFKNRFEILDLESGRKTIGFSDPSPGIKNPDYTKHFVQLLDWSPNNAYIAFANNGRAKLYQVSNQKVIDTGISQASPFGSGTFYTWLKN